MDQWFTISCFFIKILLLFNQTFYNKNSNLMYYRIFKTLYTRIIHYFDLSGRWIMNGFMDFQQYNHCNFELPLSVLYIFVPFSIVRLSFSLLLPFPSKCPRTVIHPLCRLREAFSARSTNFLTQLPKQLWTPLQQSLRKEILLALFSFPGVRTSAPFPEIS